MDQERPGEFFQSIQVMDGFHFYTELRRINRDPLGWSDEALGKLVMARIYRKNGGQITKEHFRKDDEIGTRYNLTPPY